MPSTIYSTINRVRYLTQTAEAPYIITGPPTSMLTIVSVSVAQAAPLFIQELAVTYIISSDLTTHHKTPTQQQLILCV